jgi:hypothetical protein
VLAYRFTPLAIAVASLAGSVLLCYGTMWTLSGAALLCALFAWHPADVVYQFGLRRYVPRLPPLPKGGRWRRAVFAGWALWFGAAGVAFALDQDALGRTMGGIAAVCFGLQAALLVCVPSTLAALLRPGPRRQAP